MTEWSWDEWLERSRAHKEAREKKLRQMRRINRSLYLLVSALDKMRKESKIA